MTFDFFYWRIILLKFNTLKLFIDSVLNFCENLYIRYDRDSNSSFLGLRIRLVYYKLSAFCTLQSKTQNQGFHNNKIELESKFCPRYR